MTGWTRAAAAPLLAALALALVATGVVALAVGGQRATGPVEVQLREWTIDMPPDLRAGPTAFRVTNLGSMEHSFKLQGPGPEATFADPLAPGETRVLQVDLAAGEYVVTCPLPGHAARGMRRSLRVQDPDG